MERALSEVEQPGYQDALRQALWEAAAVLVNNPLIAEMLGPYAPRLHVIPPGIDAGRFPWEDDGGPDRAQGEPVRVFMAGAIEEPFKGFAVLHEACARLWQERQDFRLSVTADTPGTIAEWGESTGWLSQEELPQHYREADICIVPSLVQEAWANTASEAMAAGRSLIASRTGGLQFMVAEEATGLLFTPGDVEELVGCLRRLLDDRELRRQLGRQGRQRFLRTCSWEALMAHHYRPLLQRMLAEAGAPPLATPAAQEVA
jgi:glycosyltransferase involved in cell wall biosynthesis